MGFRDDLTAGRVAFAHLIRLWHARNGWSHRVLPALAEVLDLGRVHNSQLSMLRNGKLASPGPEVFLALGNINRWLADQAPKGHLESDQALALLRGHPELVEALSTSALPVLDADGSVLGPGDLLEVFVGARAAPAAFELSIREEEAADLCEALAQLLTAGRPWRQCREHLLAAYPASKRARRDRFAEVMAGQRDFSAAELAAELPDLRRTLAQLGVAGEEDLGPERFLALLREKAKSLGGQPQAAPLASVSDLASAIRRELAG
ncbi:MAG: hypothetical protein VKO44_04120 [Cyanobacteriota bacterium]|nr:hypothetical protein [Cyanobacteriota bacterium]